MNRVLKTVRQRNVREKLADGTGIGSRPKTVFFFREILGNCDRILANGAKTLS
jgi:hypothetical protein